MDSGTELLLGFHTATEAGFLDALMRTVGTNLPQVFGRSLAILRPGHRFSSAGTRLRINRLVE